MTVIGRDLYSEEMIPTYRYRPSACPRCRATTLDEAEQVCRPSQDPSGEYSCPGEENCLNPFGVKWDKRGRACELTRACAAAEARALDEWILDQVERDYTERLQAEGRP